MRKDKPILKKKRKTQFDQSLRREAGIAFLEISIPYFILLIFGIVGLAQQAENIEMGMVSTNFVLFRVATGAFVGGIASVYIWNRLSKLVLIYQGREDELD